MKTVSNSRIFVDTNILHYANYPTEPLGMQAEKRMLELKSFQNTFVVSTQVLREYAHSTLRHELYQKRDLAASIAAVLRNLGRFQRDFEVLHDSPDVFQNWLALLPTLTTHKDVYDFNIAATLQANGLSHILTHNASDFSRFSKWLTVAPLFPAP